MSTLHLALPRGDADHSATQVEPIWFVTACPREGEDWGRVEPRGGGGQLSAVPSNTLFFCLHGVKLPRVPAEKLCIAGKELSRL